MRGSFWPLLKSHGVFLYWLLRWPLVSGFSGLQIWIFRVVLQQIFYTLWVPLGLIVAAGGIMGFFITELQTRHLTSGLWDEGIMAGFLEQLLLKDMGFIWISSLFLARSLSAVASDVAQLSYQKGAQVLLSVGIHPFCYVIWPRACAAAISGFLASVIWWMGVWGGHLLYRMGIGSWGIFSFSWVSRWSDWVLLGVQLMIFHGFLFGWASWQALEKTQSLLDIPKISGAMVSLGFTGLIIWEFISWMLRGM